MVAVIPARGGSKGVPGKNLRRVGGVSLVTRAVHTAHAADSIAQVCVSTDDPRIAAALVFLQCTSPFVAAADVDAAVALVLGDTVDSVFAAGANHTFLWRPDGDRVVGVNHDAAQRQPRQDRDPEYRETGASSGPRRPVRRGGSSFLRPDGGGRGTGADGTGDRHRGRPRGRLRLGSVDRSPARLLDVAAVATDIDGEPTTRSTSCRASTTRCVP